MKPPPLPLNKLRTAASGALPFVLLAALAVTLYLPSLGGGFAYDSLLGKFPGLAAPPKGVARP